MAVGWFVVSSERAAVAFRRASVIKATSADPHVRAGFVRADTFTIAMCANATSRREPPAPSPRRVCMPDEAGVEPRTKRIACYVHESVASNLDNLRQGRWKRTSSCRRTVGAQHPPMRGSVGGGGPAGWHGGAALGRRARLPLEVLPKRRGLRRGGKTGSTSRRNVGRLMRASATQLGERRQSAFTPSWIHRSSRDEVVGVL